MLIRTKQSTAVLWIRWILVLPSALFGFYLSLIVHIFLLGQIDHMGGHYWLGRLENLVQLSGSGIAAILWITCGTVVAPAYRRAVTWFLLLAGTGMALICLRAYYSDAEDNFRYLILLVTCGSGLAATAYWHCPNKAMVSASCHSK